MARTKKCIAMLILAMLTACGSKPETPDLVRASEPGFTGVARCAACHTNDYAKWKQSLHSRAMTVPTDSTVVGDFDQASHTYGGITTRMFRKNGGFYMETQNAQGHLQTYRVDYTIGVRQHQAYLTEFKDGRYQVLPLYHDGPTDTWVDAQEGGVIRGDQPLKPNEFYFWANAGRTWNFHCFDCHASRVEKHYDVETNTYRTTVGSLTIDCEACHGPSDLHDKTRGKPGESLHLVELQQLNKTASVEVCAQCHAAKEIVAKGYLPGANFYDYYQIVLPDDARFFFPDGQPRVYCYPTVLHLMSSCFTHADLRCVSCHDSHGNAREADLVAEREGVGLCESCHADITQNPVAHGHHKPGSKGNQCVECHMPYHYVTGEHLTDHRIMSPAPKNTVVNGVPNACGQSGCHADKSPEWADQWSETWYGTYQDAIVARTTAVANAQKGDRSAVPALIAMLKENADGVWRATAASLLGRLGDARAVPALQKALVDSFPMVREKAAIALGRIGDPRGISALVAALSDSSRIVRIQAPFALMDIGYLPGEAAGRDAFDAALAEHKKEVDGVQSDDPGFHESLGEVYERQGRFDAVEKEFQIVARLDPHHPKTSADLARLKKERDRFQTLDGLLKSEGGPYVQARLGALLVQTGRFKDAVEAFAGASDSLTSALFFTRIGDARLGSGDRAGAKAAYMRALHIDGAFRPAVRRVAQMAFSAVGVDAFAQADNFEGATVDALTRRGLAAAKADDWKAAAGAFALALREEATGHISAGIGRAGRQAVDALADSAFAHGRMAYDKGDEKSALPAYARAAELNPELSGAYAMQGLILADMGDLKRAERVLCDALMADPGNASALTLMGTVYQERGLAKDAVILYRQALALNPDTPGAAVFMGQAYLMQGNQDSARAVLNRVIKREPNNTQARDLLARLGKQEL